MSDAFTRALAVVREALNREGEERRRFVEESCAGDAELQREVELLFELDEGADTRFDEPRLRERHAELAKLAMPPRRLEGTGPLQSGDPRRIGEFELVRRLGRGGMGIVYEARQEHPRRTVALKTLNVTGAGERLLARFRFEAQVLGRLQHPSIAQIHEAGVFEGREGEQPYFAMELARGDDLMTWSLRPGRTLREKLTAFVRICQGVQR